LYLELVITVVIVKLYGSYGVLLSVRVMSCFVLCVMLHMITSVLFECVTMYFMMILCESVVAGGQVNRHPRLCRSP